MTALLEPALLGVVAAGFLALSGRLLRPARQRRRRDLADRHDIDSWPGVGPLAEPPPKPVIHYWPALGSERLDCCGEDPFAPGQSLAIDPRQVTCEAMRVPGRAER